MDDWSAEELERFRELMERANRELEERNEMSKETREELDKFKSSISSGTQTTTNALKGLGNAITSYASSIHQGERGAAVAGRALDSMAGTAAGVLQNFGPLGKAAGAVTKAFGKVTVAVGEQADVQYDALRGLQKFGAAANDGLEGIQSTLVGLNLTTDQLQEMVQMIGQQSPSLALFKSTVSDARVELSEIGRVMKREGVTRDLMLLGMRAEDISEAFINFTALQSDVGMTQKRGQLELANATDSYLKEMNALTKATGLERDMLEEKIRNMREEERFRAYTAGLRAEGRGDLALDAEILTSAMSGLFDEQTAKGFRDILAGNGAISSDDAAALATTMNMSQQNVQQLAEDFKTRELSSEEVLQRIAESLGQTAERTRDLASVGALGRSGNFIEGPTLERALVVEMKNIAESMQRARDERTGEIQDPEENVSRLADMTQSQIESSQNISDILQNFMDLNEISATLADTFAALSGEAANAVGAGTVDERNSGRVARNRAGVARSETDEPRNEASRFGNAPRMGERGTSRSNLPEISELIGRYSSYVGSGEEVTLSDLFQNSQMASELGRYLGKGPSQPLDLSPDTVGKIVMGQKGMQIGGEPSDGEKYRSDVRRQLIEEFGAGNIEEFRQGGIATGPRSGYLAELHGTEAIVPLSGGSIPVTISNLESKISGPIQQLAQRMDIAEDLIMNTANQQTETVQTRVDNPESTRRLAEQTGALREQISRLDRLIAVSQSNNNIMNKILQNSYA